MGFSRIKSAIKFLCFCHMLRSALGLFSPTLNSVNLFVPDLYNVYTADTLRHACLIGRSFKPRLGRNQYNLGGAAERARGFNIFSRPKF